MKRASQFKVSPAWKLLLIDMNIDIEAVLVHAKLPADLFDREKATLTPLEYFQLWHGIELAAGALDFPLLLADRLTVEAFDAPLFASICSADLNTALARIQQYKPLIGPLDLTVKVGNQLTSLVIDCYGCKSNLPKLLELSELVFFTQLSRLATRAPVNPLKVVLSELPVNLLAYQAFFGCKLFKGAQTEIQFSSEDARRPFLTANAGMWAYFENGLNKNLAKLNTASTTVERVRAVLVELLPAGYSSIEMVAEKLAMSKRTLQRKLTEESENYHAVLQSVRNDLAEHYLRRSKLSLGEIAFLLGYQEVNSFIRAFTTWKGVAPGRYRDV